MKIKMLTSIAGVDFSLSRNEETERFSAGEAQRLIAAGYAEPVAAPVIERAVAKPAREKRA